jgi:NAD(P)-dependent dehydrogenase (short-subunit alcohol dehydrogenase family)
MSDIATAPQAPVFVEKIVPGRFEGKCAIVTGAGSGIGRAVALRIAKEGGCVIAADWSADRLEELKTEHPDLNFITVNGDISQEEDVARIVAAAKGKVDCLANIAGIMDEFQPVHEVTDAVWDKVFAVNITGMMRMSRAVIGLMVEAGKGTVVNVSSEAGIRGSAAGTAYTSSKHAVVGMTLSSSVMYAPLGIRVNSVAPGGTKTNIVANFSSQLGAERLGPLMQVVVPPAAEASELAAAITFLLSDDSPNITGVVLPCDGGWSAI